MNSERAVIGVSHATQRAPSSVTATALERDPGGQLQLPRRPGRDRRADQRPTHGANVTSVIDAIEQVDVRFGANEIGLAASGGEGTRDGDDTPPFANARQEEER